MLLFVLYKSFVKQRIPTYPAASVPVFYNSTQSTDAPLQAWVNKAGNFVNQSCLVVGFSTCGANCSQRVFDAFAHFFSKHMKTSIQAEGYEGMFCTEAQMTASGPKSCLPPLLMEKFDSEDALVEAAMAQVRASSPSEGLVAAVLADRTHDVAPRILSGCCCC